MTHFMRIDINWVPGGVAEVLSVDLPWIRADMSGKMPSYPSAGPARRSRDKLSW